MPSQRIFVVFNFRFRHFPSCQTKGIAKKAFPKKTPVTHWDDLLWQPWSRQLELVQRCNELWDVHCTSHVHAGHSSQHHKLLASSSEHRSEICCNYTSPVVTYTSLPDDAGHQSEQDSNVARRHVICTSASIQYGSTALYKALKTLSMSLGHGIGTRDESVEALAAM